MHPFKREEYISQIKIVERSQNAERREFGEIFFREYCAKPCIRVLQGNRANRMYMCVFVCVYVCECVYLSIYMKIFILGNWPM